MISAGSCGDRPFKSQSGNLAVGGVDSGEIEISFKIGKVKALIELFLGFHPNYSVIRLGASREVLRLTATARQPIAMRKAAFKVRRSDDGSRGENSIRKEYP